VWNLERTGLLVMASIAPPGYKNAAKCYGCGVQFTFINRKHHCRNCGNTFCNDCSQKKASLPSYGFTEAVRVCEKCYDDLRATQTLGHQKAEQETASSSKSSESDKPKVSSSTSTTTATSSSTRKSEMPAQIRDDDDDDEVEEKESEPENTKNNKEEGKKETRKRVKDCKCNMPLCICPTDPETEEEKDAREKTGKTSRVDKKKPTPSTSSSATPTSPPSSSFIGFGQKATRQYDLKGDLNNQCREAVKAQDIEGVKLLLKSGAKADYKDRTGNTLLHLAAMFDNTELVKVLINAGADPWIQNPAKESAIDIAPPALALKMKTLVPKEQTS